MSILVRLWQDHFKEQGVKFLSDAERIKKLEAQVEALTLEKTKLISKNAEVAYALHGMVGVEKRAKVMARRWGCIAAGLAMLAVGIVPLLLDAAHLLHLIDKPHIYTRLFIMGSMTIIGVALATYGWLRYR